MFNLKKLEQKEKDLIKKLFLQPIILSVVFVILTGFSVLIVIFIYEKNNFSKDINTMLHLKKEYIKNRVITLSKRDIDNTLKLANKRTKEDIKRKVEEIYSQLLSIDRLNIPNKKKIAIEYLNNLNKFKKNNYIFVYDAKSGVIYVDKNKKFIGKNTKNIILKSGESIYKRNENILDNKNGFYETYLYKDNNDSKKYLKIHYLKYVPEFNFIIDSGEYVKNIKNKIIKNIYQRISVKRFGNDNYFFILKPNGVFITDGIKKFIGKNALKLKDKNGTYFIKEMIKEALHNKNGAFISYYWINPATNKIEQKLSYVIYNKNLNAIIGSGIYYKKSIEKAIKQEKNRLKKHIFYINLILIIAIILVLIISVAVSFYFSKKLKNIFKIYNKNLKKLLKEVEFEASHDNLTKAPNRKLFNEKLKEEFYRAKRYNTPLSIAMIDIDHFKSINDTYGHDAGDLVLQKLASFCQRHIRKSDMFARWGGEEFMFIFPNTNIQAAVKICEKIKNDLQNDKNIQEPIKFTISCGVSELIKNDTIDTFLKRVDEMLYKAKEEGRDRIEFI